MKTIGVEAQGELFGEKLKEVVGYVDTLTTIVDGVQPIPVTVYVVVTVGVTNTLVPFVEFNPEDGVHENPEHPEADRLIDSPIAQIVEGLGIELIVQLCEKAKL